MCIILNSVRWLTKIAFFLLISCANAPNSSKQACSNKSLSNTDISVVIHVRSLSDLERASYLMEEPAKVFLSHGIKIHIDKIVFSNQSSIELDIVGTPDFRREGFEEDEKVHIFFINTLYGDDDDELYGLHVKTANRCKTYILIPDNTDILTIAHEIGHEYGLSHSHDRNNVMESGNRLEGATFTHSQIEIMKKEISKKNAECS